MMDNQFLINKTIFLKMRFLQIKLLKSFSFLFMFTVLFVASKGFSDSISQRSLSQLKIAQSEKESADFLFFPTATLQTAKAEIARDDKGTYELSLTGTIRSSQIQCEFEVSADDPLQTRSISRKSMNGQLISLMIKNNNRSSIQWRAIVKENQNGKYGYRSLALICDQNKPLFLDQIQQQVGRAFQFLLTPQQTPAAQLKSAAIDQELWLEKAHLVFKKEIHLFPVEGASQSRWSQASFQKGEKRQWSPLKFELQPNESFCKISTMQDYPHLKSGSVWQVQKATVGYYYHWNQPRTLEYQITLSGPVLLQLNCYSRDTSQTFENLLLSNVGI